MNFLAHAYLSFHHPFILVGNLSCDTIKGKQRFTIHPEVQKGFELHRSIDSFTDAHPATKAGIAVLKPVSGKFACVFLDIIFDYFLANDKQEFESQEALQAFSMWVYQSLEQNTHILPPPFLRHFASMKAHNWLFNYSKKIGIYKSFEGLQKRTMHQTQYKQAYQLWLEKYKTFEFVYQSVWDDLKAHANHTFAQLTNNNNIALQKKHTYES